MAQTTETFTTKIERPASQAGMAYIPVASKAGEKFPFHGRTRRVLCSINETEAFSCALMPARGAFYIICSKALMKRLCVEPGQTVAVRLEADTSRYGMPMPEEFQAVLDQDADGDKLFHALTVGKQRSILWQIAKIKDIDERIRVGLIVLEHLRRNGGSVDGTELYREVRSRPKI